MRTWSWFFAILTLWFALPLQSRAQTLPPSPKAPFLLDKPLAEVEKVLGKPKHTDSEGKRYYKTAGFVRVVLELAPNKTIDSLTFQFAPRTVKSEAKARERLGISDATPLAGWSVRWSAPGSSGNDELELSRESPPTKTLAFKLTQHFLQRLKERGVSPQAATDLLENGQRFYDPKNDSYIYWKDGIYVAMSRDGAMKTVVRGAISKRWKPL